jgi:hypothetical protein
MVGDMTQSPAFAPDVVREHYRRMAGSLILGKAAPVLPELSRLGSLAPTRYIPGMPKRKRVTEWEVIRIKATPAAFVGFVNAPDEATALKTAIKQFNIRREDQSQLIVRPR